MDYETKPVMTIAEAEREYAKIAETSDLYFGQFVKKLQNEGVKIIYSTQSGD